MNDTKHDSLYLPSLTGIRAIAAYMVYLHHNNPFNNETTIYNFVEELHVGVTFFFVLSGFLISYRYISIPKLNLRAYFVNRIARIYPMYILITLITFFIMYYEERVFDGLTFLLNISFLKGLFNEFKFSGVAQGWTLTVEECFYLSAPIIFIILRINRFLVLLIPLLLVSFGFYLVHFFQNRNFYGFFDSNTFMLIYTFFGRCFEFFIGISLAIVVNKFNSKFKNLKPTYIGIILTFLFIYLMSNLKSEVYEFGVFSPGGIIINNFLLPLLGISFMFYGLIYEKTFISKILGSNIFILLGKSSYIFYLIHMGVLMNLVKGISNNFIIDFVIINTISIIMFNYLEEPLNIFIRNFSINKN